MLSALIPTYNEEDNIKAAIESVSFADEIIVIDSFSTDKTVEIANSLNVRLIQRKFDTHARQKNAALSAAKHQWVLLLDADERITPELETEIVGTLKNPQSDAYWVYRNNHFMGRHLRFSGIKRDKVIRLVNADKCRYNDKRIHEEIDTKSIKVEYFNNKLCHNTFKSYDDFVIKLMHYAKKQSEERDLKSVNAYHLVFKPLFRFLKHFVLGLGFLDGFPGFVFACANAHSVYSRYVYLKMKQKK